jgi:hypothetical protein
MLLQVGAKDSLLLKYGTLAKRMLMQVGAGDSLLLECETLVKIAVAGRGWGGLPAVVA